MELRSATTLSLTKLAKAVLAAYGRREDGKALHDSREGAILGGHAEKSG